MALGYSRILRRNRLFSVYDLAEMEDPNGDRINLGTGPRIMRRPTGDLEEYPVNCSMI